MVLLKIINTNNNWSFQNEVTDAKLLERRNKNQNSKRNFLSK